MEDADRATPGADGEGAGDAAAAETGLPALLGAGVEAGLAVPPDLDADGTGVAATSAGAVGVGGDWISTVRD